MKLWRISEHIDLLGEGGLVFNSRWNTVGSRIVYLAESPTGAMIEILAHLELDSEDIPYYTLLEVSVPTGIEVADIKVPEGGSWKQSVELTRKLGDAWLASLKTPLARVPSAVAPQTWNYLMNPEHPDAKKIEIAAVIRDQFDNRLFRFGAR